MVGICMARIAVNQDGVDNLLHRLIKKHQSNSCDIFFGNITLCDTRANDCIDIHITFDNVFVLCDYTIDYGNIRGNISICNSNGTDCNVGYVYGNLPIGK
ncbi:unnamed protein product [Rotaria sordida]|uniref:Uncharacterized protein n=1 Tax=Rotaria sordida TaxID=392033 RepID=A0A819YJC7_9BILA|nr:unnamed protein product [Rotaria sordida]CAF4159177.1 unnamed protein product [Rotaria sordida]